MKKYLIAASTLVALAAPVLADGNHDYIDSCPANKYECDVLPMVNHKHRSVHPFKVYRPDIDERDQEEYAPRTSSKKYN
jgi:hypothetical protein